MTINLRLLWAALAAALLATACCHPLPEPPVVIIETDASLDECTRACMKLRVWGCREGADTDAGTCESDCRRVTSEGFDLGQACLAKAVTATEARACTTKHGAPAVRCR